MTIPSEVLAILEPLVKRYEGCRLVSYQDPNGIWTIGYGHTGLDIVPGLVWTQDQCESQLLIDLNAAYSQLVQSVPAIAQQSPGRQASIADFVYNLGEGTFHTSSLRSAIILGAWQNVPRLLSQWVHAGGKILPGLVARRQAEIDLIDS